MPGGVASQGKCRRFLKVHPRVRPWRSAAPSWDKGWGQRLRCWIGRRFARTAVRSIRNAVRCVGGGSSAVGSSCPPDDHPPTPGMETRWRDLHARGSTSWLGAWSVLPGQHLSPATSAPQASLFTDAELVTPHRLFRLISLGGVRHSGSPAQYKLHSSAARGVGVVQQGFGADRRPLYGCSLLCAITRATRAVAPGAWPAHGSSNA
jgi:hypothetical protein